MLSAVIAHAKLEKPRGRSLTDSLTHSLLCSSSQSVAGPLDMHAVGRCRKRAGHELSKNRFVAAQLLAYFGADMELWRCVRGHVARVFFSQSFSRVKLIDLRGKQAQRDACERNSFSARVGIRKQAR